MCMRHPTTSALGPAGQALFWGRASSGVLGPVALGKGVGPKYSIAKQMQEINLAHGRRIVDITACERGQRVTGARQQRKEHGPAGEMVAGVECRGDQVRR